MAEREKLKWHLIHNLQSMVQEFFALHRWNLIIENSILNILSFKIMLEYKL